jgi:hypothetical protein
MAATFALEHDERVVSGARLWALEPQILAKKIHK